MDHGVDNTAQPDYNQIPLFPQSRTAAIEDSNEELVPATDNTMEIDSVPQPSENTNEPLQQVST